MVIEFSEVVLDKSLVDVPAGYRPALLRLIGRFEMAKPDTVANRFAAYWDELTTWFVASADSDQRFPPSSCRTTRSSASRRIGTASGHPCSRPVFSFGPNDAPEGCQLGFVTGS